MLQGLEALIINKTEMANLDRAYKRLLKSPTSLRDGIADEAVYILMGLLPAEAELINESCPYGSITRLNEEHPLRRLGLRQAAIPSEKRYSWFGNVHAVTRIYGIEATVMAATITPWQKSEWIEMIRSAMCTGFTAQGQMPRESPQ